MTANTDVVTGDVWLSKLLRHSKSLAYNLECHRDFLDLLSSIDRRLLGD